ncbi:molybdenum cofactor biosysynthesis protein [Sphaerisporangium rufum]|uniref:Molybdenum cofactor biosysynthesis protein n=1 Tax=Sphaerisporangium rufum TaxID=1381558 RepID=A0A919UZW1_9ACTN|nr:MOSC N-terminal beta barrel domain-containing protein [Sphaerisporangium rufum]GII76737.1 molybdenum cofactor biosysynthesis protein [Sphaerisporangium rufum]
MQIIDLRVYPVKSFGGLSVPAATVHPWGLAGDRRWAVTGPDGEVLTARDLPGMLAISAEAREDGGVLLRAAGSPDLAVPPPAGGPPAAIRLRGLDRAVDAGTTAAAWVSAAVGRPARLVWLDDPRRRPMSEEHGGRPGDTFVLQDDAPLLLTTAASLDRLSAWIAEEAALRGEDEPGPLAGIRFRPNVVVDGTEPFAEDSWTRVRLGDTWFRFAERCDRCTMTTVDPATYRKGKEPIRTLSRHRKQDGKVWFGIRLVPEAPGELRVGDEVAAGVHPTGTATAG